MIINKKDTYDFLHVNFLVIIFFFFIKFVAFNYLFDIYNPKGDFSKLEIESQIISFISALFPVYLFKNLFKNGEFKSSVIWVLYLFYYLSFSIFGIYILPIGKFINFIIIANLSFLIIHLSSCLPINIKVLKLNRKSLNFLVFLFLSLIGFYIWSLSDFSTSLNLFDVYLRRSESSTGGSFIDYLIAFPFTFFSPFSIYFVFYKKQYKWLIPLILIILGIYGFHGLKTILFIPFFILLTYIGLKNNNLIICYLYTFITINFIGIFESIFFNSSLFNELITRRIFLVPGVISSYYLDHISNIEKTSDITYEIGRYYFSNPDMNANSNFLIHSFITNGYPGIILVSILIGIIVLIFRKTPGDNYPFLGKLICCNILFILTEQALHTSMLSSGVFWAIIISYLLKDKVIEKNE